MIYLTTGQPGAGKTLYTLNFVKEFSEKNPARPVYYSGINDLKLPWIELDDATQWHTLPDGAIVVIDEAQRVFRPRANGSVVPKHVEALETHRHRGIDLFIVTQHPMLVESNVRKLVGCHFHVMRKFGTKMATVHEWNEVRESVDKSRSNSIRHEWRYPKDIFALYKSAELHTHRVRIPARVFFLLACPLLLAAIGWSIYQWIAAKAAPAEAVPVSTAAAVGVPSKSSATADPKVLTPAQYVESHQPRIDGLAYTAPIYDEVTKPVRAPFPAACAVMKGDCRCFTQDATRLDVPEALCRSIVDRGFFRSWKEEGGSASVQPSKQPLSAEQVSAAPVMVYGLAGRAHAREQGTRDGSVEVALSSTDSEQGSEREPANETPEDRPKVPLTSPRHFNNRLSASPPTGLPIGAPSGF